MSAGNSPDQNYDTALKSVVHCSVTYYILIRRKYTVLWNWFSKSPKQSSHGLWNPKYDYYIKPETKGLFFFKYLFSALNKTLISVEQNDIWNETLWTTNFKADNE